MTIMDAEDMLLALLRLEIGIRMEGTIEIVTLVEGLMLLRRLLHHHHHLAIGYHPRQAMIGEILEDHHHLFHHRLRHTRTPRLRRCRSGKEIGRGIDRIDIHILQTEIMPEVSFVGLWDDFGIDSFFL
jgi:hypothetical protein